MRQHAPPSPVSLRLSRARHVSLYAVGFGLWLTGALWLVFHYGLRQPGEFGPGMHPLEPWWLRLHGAFAFGAIWMLGLLWGAHIAPGWSGSQRRRSGGWLAGSLIWLTTGGYLLYYLGNEQARSVISLLHWLPGLALPILFAAHRLSRSTGPIADQRLRPRRSHRVRWRSRH
ncbi:MAG TPA: hypothetical protein VMI34_18290 [Candidatus Bathyarchaeia archaeon]|nr:hypothetical protein [Candidatus Bathyarchaeia archaeon]